MANCSLLAVIILLSTAGLRVIGSHVKFFAVSSHALHTNSGADRELFACVCVCVWCADAALFHGQEIAITEAGDMAVAEAEAPFCAAWKVAQCGYDTSHETRKALFAVSGVELAAGAHVAMSWVGPAASAGTSRYAYVLAGFSGRQPELPETQSIERGQTDRRAGWGRTHVH